MYRRFSVVLHISLLNHVFPFSVIFETFSLDFRGGESEGFLFVLVEGFTHEYLETLFLVILPHKFVEKLSIRRFS